MPNPETIIALDVETTGLFPGGADRIIEIAVVHARLDGTIIDQYVSLVNPGRDVGRTDIHGISAGDVLNAPTFAEILGDVCEMVTNSGGGTVVGHNVMFDARFLEAELRHAGFELPSTPMFCTLQALGGNLRDCCRDYGVEHETWHSALDDALAAAKLFARWLEDNGSDPWRDRVFTYGTPRAVWPNSARSSRSYGRSSAAIDRQERASYLGQLVKRLPASAGSESPQAFIVYYEMLDRILEDRRIDEMERGEIEDLAAEWGLTRAQATQAHYAYLSRLATLAMSDGKLSSAERDDLEWVRALFHISQLELDALLAATDTGEKPTGTSRLAGKSVCFTGALTCSLNGATMTRDAAQLFATNAGMVILAGVTKKLDVLVLADPDSQSGKAKKAREYGTRLMAEPVFWRETGVAVD